MDTAVTRKRLEEMLSGLDRSIAVLKGESPATRALYGLDDDRPRDERRQDRPRHGVKRSGRNQDERSPLESRVQRPQEHLVKPSARMCRRVGRKWQLTWQNRSVLVEDSVGMLHLAVLIANPARARHELGFDPICSDIETIVRTAWAWHRRAHPGRQQHAGGIR